MTDKKNIIQKLKKHWGINSGLQVVIILIVFSCTGFSVLYVEELILKLININSSNWWVAILIFLLITLPLYNVLLLIYGFIFGQFKFFWRFEKRFFGRIINLFVKKN